MKVISPQQAACDSLWVQAVHQVLREIPYNASRVYLHTDRALMPRCREAWASWNVLGDSGSSQEASVCVTYWVNRLQVPSPRWLL